MRTTIALLVLVLVATNAAWWLTRPEARVEAAPPTPVDAAPAAGAREAELAAELARTKARVAELEARAKEHAERTPAPTPATAQPDRAARDEARRIAAERAQAVRDRQKAWVEAALQTTDPARRAAAIEEIRQALLGTDPAMVQAALRALAGIRELDYDKAAFRPLVLPCLRSEDGAVRAAALYALWNTAPDAAADLPVLLAMGNDPSPQVRGSLAHVIGMYNKGVLEGEAAEVVLKLLNDGDRMVRRSTMSGIGGRVDARIEDHFLHMLDDREQRQEAVHFALSSFDPKSTRVVQTLLTLAADPDFEVASSARHGLSNGVAKADHGAVADAFLQLLETRSDPVLVADCVEKLRRYGSARHVPALETYLARPGITAATRQQIEPLVAALRTR